MVIHNPPENFIPAGRVTWARLSSTAPGFINTGARKSGAKLQGLRYEKKANEALEARFSWRYLQGPWILFGSEEHSTRWCQPDGLLIFPEEGKIVIVEIKYNHTAQAWWQLFQLYMPVVQRLFGPTWVYSCCEMTKWYDSYTSCPQEVKLRSRIERTLPNEFGVNIWNPTNARDGLE